MKVLFISGRKELSEDLGIAVVLSGNGDLDVHTEDDPKNAEKAIEAYSPDLVVLNYDALVKRDSWNLGVKTVYCAANKEDLEDGADYGLETIGVATDANEIIEKMGEKPYMAKPSGKKKKPRVPDAPSETAMKVEKKKSKPQEVEEPEEEDDPLADLFDEPEDEPDEVPIPVPVSKPKKSKRNEDFDDDYDDEPRRGSSKRRRDEDDDYDDEPRRGSSKRRRDEDDDYDEEPKRGSSKRRRDEDDDYDDEPRRGSSKRRRDEDDDYDDEPRRGSSKRRRDEDDEPRRRSSKRRRDDDEDDYDDEPRRRSSKRKRDEDFDPDYEEKYDDIDEELERKYSKKKSSKRRDDEADDDGRRSKRGDDGRGSKKAKKRKDVVGDEFDKDVNGGEHETKIVAVYSAKGGVGKTTIAAELAMYLSLVDLGPRKLRVCIVDYNIDFGDVKSTLGMEKSSKSVTYWADEIQEFLGKGVDPNSIVYTKQEMEDYMVQSDKSELWILPAPVSNEDSMGIESEALRVILRNLKENGEFDFIVCDTGNNTRDSTMIALENANTILMIMTQNVNTANCDISFMKTMETIDFDMSNTRLVINNIVPQKLTGIGVEEIENYFPFECVGKIHYNPDVIKATNLGEPLALDPSHEFTKQMKEIVAYVLDDDSMKPDPTPEKKGLFGFLKKSKKPKKK